jgi:hypothetical protein
MRSLGEEAAQRDALEISCGEALLDLPEADLGRPDVPQVIEVELLEGGAFAVEGADVAALHDVVVSLLLEPQQRQSLGAADVGTLLVDSAGSLAVEKGAGPRWMRSPVLQELGVVAADAIGFDGEDAEPVLAASAAAALASQPFGVMRLELAGSALYGVVKIDEGATVKIEVCGRCVQVPAPPGRLRRFRSAANREERPCRSRAQSPAGRSIRSVVWRR